MSRHPKRELFTLIPVIFFNQGIEKHEARSKEDHAAEKTK